MEHESNDRRRRPTQAERAARPAQPVKKKRRTSPAALELAPAEGTPPRGAAAGAADVRAGTPRQTTERPRRQAEPERRQRVPSPARSSRAAQTAQRHREERKESNYLQGQRRETAASGEAAHADAHRQGRMETDRRDGGHRDRRRAEHGDLLPRAGREGLRQLEIFRSAGRRCLRRGQRATIC